MKQEIMQKWAEAGLTAEDVKQFIKKADPFNWGNAATIGKGLGSAGMGLGKGLWDFGIGALDFFSTQGPIMAFTLPLIGGSLAYAATHTGDIKDRANKERLKVIERELQNIRDVKDYARG